MQDDGFRKYILWSILCSTLIFIVTFYFYSIHASAKEATQLQQHASIMSKRVWAMDRNGVEDYLNLITQIESYTNISVIELDGKTFAATNGNDLAKIEQYLLRTYLIQPKHFKTDIVYQDQTIAQLRGIKNVRLTEPALNLYIVISVLTFLCLFILRGSKGRNSLKQSLHNRTQSLYESEVRFEEFINLLPEIVWETDKHGEIQYINQQGRKRFAISSTPSLSFYKLFVSSEQERIKNDFKKALTGEDIGFNEILAQDKQGYPFPLFLRWSIIVRDGDVLGLRILGIDLSERVRLEKQLEKDRRIKELGMMAGGVAHDLNNILSGVVGYADLLLLEKSQTPHEANMVRGIKKAGLQAAEVVENLLMVVRGGSIIREKADLIVIVEDYLKSPDFKRLERENPEVKIKTELKTLTAPLYCSPIQIRKILMNILINATEAIEEAGRVRFKIYTRYFHNPFQCLNKEIEPGEYVCLSFEDNGVGIDPATIDQIFEPFYSNKKMGKSGTGLGMSLVWNAVNDHNGGLLLQNLNRGTLIKIYLPMMQDKSNLALEQETAPTQLKYKGQGQKILVVDDDPRQCYLATTILSSLGYNVKSVPSGEKAIPWLKKNKVDLLVLDMLLGDGIDGGTTYAEACLIKPDQKAIIVSGYANRDDVSEVIAMGAHTLVHKPYTIEQIARAVHHALEHK